MKKSEIAQELGLPRPWAKYDTWSWEEFWFYADREFPITVQHFIIDHNPPHVPSIIKRKANEWAQLLALNRKRTKEVAR